MLRCQRSRGGSARGTDERCLDTGQGITCRGIVYNQHGRRSGQVADPVFREARYPFDAASLNRAAEMRRQRDDASAGLVRISEEVAVRIESVSGGVKAVCRLYGTENLAPVSVNDTLNRRARNNVECRSSCHD